MRAGDREPSYCLVGVKRQIDGVEMSLTALVLAILVLVILGFLILGYVRFWEWTGMTGQSISNERQNKRTELDGALLLRSSGGARRRIAPSAFEWAYVSWDNALAGISSTPQRSGVYGVGRGALTSTRKPCGYRAAHGTGACKRRSISSGRSSRSPARAEL
jgi:hypothetical protein